MGFRLGAHPWIALSIVAASLTTTALDAMPSVVAAEAESGPPTSPPARVCGDQSLLSGPPVASCGCSADHHRPGHQPRHSFVDNWDGVVLWENADRFFNSPANPSGTAYVPKGGVASTTTCNDPAKGGSIDEEPAYSDCRWKTKDVKVSGNTFAFDPAAVGCTAGLCGRNAMFSQYGTYPSWSPYKAGPSPTPSRSTRATPGPRTATPGAGGSSSTTRT